MRSRSERIRYYQLVADLQARDANRRRRALIAFGEWEGDGVIGPVTRRLFDSEPGIRQLALRVLRKHGLGGPASAVLSLYDLGAAGRANAVEAVHPLLRAPLPFCHFAVLAVVGAGLAELFEEIACLGIEIREKYIRRAAIEGLYDWNQPALADAFLLASSDADPIVRRYAAAGLAEHGITSQSFRLCHDVDPEVRRVAFEAFSNPRTPISVRDKHREIITMSHIYALPESGTRLVPHERLRSLKPIAERFIQSDRAADVLVGLATLERFGVDVTTCCVSESGKSDAMVRRFLANRMRLKQLSHPRGAGNAAKPVFDDLAGKRVVIVGGDSNHAAVVKGLTEIGIDVSWFSGFNSRVLKGPFASADALVIVWHEVSHATSMGAAVICERLNVPTVFARSATWQAVVEALLDVL